MRVRVIVVMIIVIGLCVSHYLSFREGQTNGLEEIGPAVENIRNVEAYAHLTYAIMPLRVLAAYPDSLPADDAETLCRKVREYIQFIEEREMPQLREAGNVKDLDRREALVREARTLLAKCRR